METWILIVSLVGAIASFMLGDIPTTGGALYIAVTIFFANIAAGSIAEVIRRTCVPDTIYYNRTSELIKARIFWSIGIHVSAVGLTSLYGTMFLSELNWWQILIVLILALIASMISGAMISTEKD